ncbi:MAG: helix-turn-helix domain-containing protein [Candidatus Aenigmarchaeota archaeon]|nr:helix-turn-helix domain-containing protein [Candidatus Aenigmarchaeota archaeon]
MRKGKEFYARQYDAVQELFSKGVPIQEIAKQLNMSYSCVYHWVRGLRKPRRGNVDTLVEFLHTHGPTPVVDIEAAFPKHNELFHIASKRGVPIRRKVLSRAYGAYATWYFLDGQEPQLEERIAQLVSTLRAVKERLKKALNP